MKKQLIPLLIILLFLTGCAVEQNRTSNNDSVSNNGRTTGSIKESPSITIEYVVDSFNENSNTKLVYIEDFEVQNKENSHYRTEYRLPRFSDSIGKSYKYGERTVDVVLMNSIKEDPDIRVYVSCASIEECVKIIRIISPILDNSIDGTALEDTVNYVLENKSANGYYYGKLGLVLSNNEMMIKTD